MSSLRTSDLPDLWESYHVLQSRYKDYNNQTIKSKREESVSISKDRQCPV